MKLMKVKKITGNITVETGLHIGGSVEGLEIGGIDNPILRNKTNDEPYIPGSSLKGKMRSLMDWQLDTMDAKGQTCQCAAKDCPVCRVFGVSSNKNNLLGPTRLIVRDAFISPDSRNKFQQGQEITEIKHENSINRITAEANPRPLERVVPGVQFDLDISYRVFEMDGDSGKGDEDYFNQVVLKSFRLIEDDCLGGAGSRGCGKVRFENLKDENGNPIELPKA